MTTFDISDDWHNTDWVEQVLSEANSEAKYASLENEGFSCFVTSTALL